MFEICFNYEEDISFCDLLQDFYLKNPNTIYAGYSKDHPSDTHVKFKIISNINFKDLTKEVLLDLQQSVKKLNQT